MNEMHHQLCDYLQDFGSDLSLNTYMQLPVEQYYELDPTMIWPLGGKRFALKVPRVNVSSLIVWQPRAEPDAGAPIPACQLGAAHSLNSCLMYECPICEY